MLKFRFVARRGGYKIIGELVHIVLKENGVATRDLLQYNSTDESVAIETQTLISQN